MVQAVTCRIAWCRRQRARASNPMEWEAWRAEEDGLRDAVLQRDHLHKYRAHSPNLLRRYLLGFQDAKTIMRTARLARKWGPRSSPSDRERLQCP